jgi:NuA3 HAT complex component NTO1
MVIIYRGEAVRTPIADLREARYERDGTDCYLLRADDHTVVDCTNMGNIARFTNHSCDPNMYTKIIKSGGEHHVCFFARIDVPAGTEMTYNYRFEIEDGKVPCYCASQNCRGYLA